MTLKQVEAFYWAATLANFSRAAERLFLSQSSLSKRIAELEVQLGKPLFDRSGHRALLTPAGKTLLPLARRFIRAGNDLVEGMSESVQVRGICRFGMGELAALSWLPRLVASARAAFPDLVMEPHVELGQTLEQRVESGELDFAVVAGKSNRAALSSHVIAKVHFHWVGAPSLVGTHRVVNQRLLEQLAVITMPGEAGSAREFDNWLIANGLEVDRRLRCNNLGAIVGLVTAGVGISFLPDGWIDPLVKRGELVRLESSPALPALAYAFQARRDEVRPLVRQMRTLVTRDADFALPNRLL
jgi:DNA-binding transcriptional LysR family regulator